MDLLQIKDKIADLQSGDTTWQNLYKLATLYSVYDRMSGERPPVFANEIIEVLPDLGIGDFEEAISGKPVYPVIDLLSEHMDVIRTLYPSEYRELISQLKSIT